MTNKKAIFFLSLAIAAAVFVSATEGRQAQIQNPNIKIRRGDFPQLMPKINDASYICLGAPGREFGVHGQLFGATQGTRRVLVNGYPIPAVYSWSADTISGTGPVWDIDHTYQIAIDNGTTVISNVLTKKFPFQWDAAIPGHASAGADVDLVGWGGGPAQTDKVVKVGGTTAVVLSWTQSSPTVTENHIHIRVPALAPGTYPITVWKAGVNVTKSPLNFIIN
jgi:hypothetical protein